MKILLLALMVILTSCGKLELEVKAPEEDLISGESYNYVIVRVEYIQEIKEQCTNQYPMYDFNMEDSNEVQYRNKLISDCFFDNLPEIDFNAINEFNNTICQKPVKQQTPDEQQACGAIND